MDVFVLVIIGVRRQTKTIIVSSYLMRYFASLPLKMESDWWKNTGYASGGLDDSKYLSTERG